MALDMLKMVEGTMTNQIALDAPCLTAEAISHKIASNLTKLQLTGMNLKNLLYRYCLKNERKKK